MTDRADIQRARRYIREEELTEEQFVALFPPKFVRRNLAKVASAFRREERPRVVPHVRRETDRLGRRHARDPRTGRFVKA